MMCDILTFRRQLFLLVTIRSRRAGTMATERNSAPASSPAPWYPRQGCPPKALVRVMQLAGPLHSFRVMISPLPLTFVADLRTRDRTRQQYAHEAASGAQVRVARGVYAPGAMWRELRDTDHYLALVHAIAGTRASPPILSHWSAAAIHGLPMIGRWPPSVHLTVPASSGSRSRNLVTRHAMSLEADEIVEVDGLSVTSLIRTVVDVAALGQFLPAVAMADHALHEDRHGRTSPWCTREELLVQCRRRMPFRGHARARQVIDFAVSLSDSPLESLSRVNMHLIGFPSPQLQVPFTDHLGLIGYADYFWPDHSLIGEADGDKKYLDAGFRNGRTTEEVLLAQLKRENRLRALGFDVARWDWATAASLADLRTHLHAAGLPTPRR